MLDEQILEELTRNTSLQRHLVCTSWPSLSVESKLQLVAKIQNRSSSYTPDWLAELALDDPHPIVRYWILRHAYFSKEDTQPLQRALSDPNEFVRQSVGHPSDTWGFDHLLEAVQVERLINIRNLRNPSFLMFIEWLKKAVESGIDDGELRDCANEFFCLPDVREELKRDRGEIRDGYHAYQLNKAMHLGWELTKSAGLGLRVILTYSLPTRCGLGQMELDELAQLPEEVLKDLVGMFNPSREIHALCELVRKSPERFPPSVVEELSKTDERAWEYELDPSEIAQSRILAEVERQKATLTAIIELTGQVRMLRGEVGEAANRKRGLFG